MEKNKNVNAFISDLENKIILDEKKLEDFEKQKHNILYLIDYIKNLQVLLMKPDTDEGSIIQCNIGNGIYMNGKLNKSNKQIIINIGHDVYVEMSYPEAIDNLLNQEKIIDKRILLIRKELVKNKSYIKLTRGINETLVKHQLLEGNLIQNVDSKKEEGNNGFNI